MCPAGIACATVPASAISSVAPATRQPRTGELVLEIVIVITFNTDRIAVKMILEAGLVGVLKQG
jgi:hypothetical protein